MDRSATCIPSRVLHLPPPLLQPRGSGWASVQPSPDRASLLLCGRSECQLLAVSSFAVQVPSSSRSCEDHAHRWAAQPWNQRGSAGNSSVAEGGAGPCIVLPQPHRDLTSSCWLSAGLYRRDENDDGGGDVDTDHAAPGAIVGLGDAASVVTIVRPSPLSRASASHSTASTWLQATIFLEDEEDAVFASSASLALRHQHYDHHDYLNKGAALGRPCPSWRAPQVAPAWKAVEAILPCNYESCRAGGGLTDMYILCQRVDDVYVGSGIAAAGRSARQPCSAVWLASAQRESAWRVPLALPPGESEDAADSSGYGAAACSSAALRRAVRRTPRLFDVRRRLQPPPQNATLHQPSSHIPASPPARQRASNTEGGPLGLVFAAAFRRHVGLYTTSTVTPTVFFELPTWLTEGGGGGTAAGAATSPAGRCSSWSVASVVETPSFAVAEESAPQAPSISDSSDYSYVVTVMRDQRCRRRSGAQTAQAKVEHRGEPSQGDANSSGSDGDCCGSLLSSSGSCWWLLYDCRNPSMPVWAAEEALVAPPALDDEVWHDAPVVTEWLPSPSLSRVSKAGLRCTPLCATYVPLATTYADASSALAVPLACGVSVVLDGGARMPDGADVDAEDDAAERGEVASILAPIMYELSPPRSLLAPSPGAAKAATAKPPRVRALTFVNDVLHYACEAL
ncbi:hypothetical protein CUR178_07608 [Leishmania enriettii]|uniref:Uncharacterized protein n=1 Tax=Leishmania enriettii TaxID=5663 RepID=A0A836GQG8_LEIEN|nr:hypothetical protein CUR178_07608 [Leishmania enriettii]